VTFPTALYTRLGYKRITIPRMAWFLGELLRAA
jgi:hypothetical protein